MRKTIPPFPAEVYALRRRRLIESLPDNSVLILYSGESYVKSLDMKFEFYGDADFIYLTGIEEEDCRYVAIKNGSDTVEQLYIDPIDKEREQWDGVMLTSESAVEISGISKVMANFQFEKQLFRALRYADYVCCSLNNIHSNQALSYWHRYLNELAVRFPGTVFKKITAEINRLRLQKDAEEIKRIQAATDIICEGMLQAMKMTKPNLYEYRLEALITSVYHHSGCQNGFDMIVGSGKNSTILHYNLNNSKMQDGDMVLIDTGVSYGGYNADITRTIPVNGVFTKRQRQVYETNLSIQLEVISNIKPGMTSDALLKMAAEIQGRTLKQNGFTDDEKKHAHITVHRIGHPIGVDVHDPVDTRLPLPVNAVMTVEPGMYLPEENIGVRIEDMVVLTDNGCRVLSEKIPKQPEEIEEIMKTLRI